MCIILRVYTCSQCIIDSIVIYSKHDRPELFSRHRFVMTMSKKNDSVCHAKEDTHCDLAAAVGVKD